MVINRAYLEEAMVLKGLMVGKSLTKRDREFRESGNCCYGSVFTVLSIGASQNYKDICCYYNLRRQGSYESWQTWKVMESKFSFSRPEKSWNLVVAHGRSRTIVLCVVRKLLQMSKQG